jgi:hypothetical protein
MSAGIKYTLVANILLIIFPILFAITVCNSVYKENTKLTTQQIFENENPQHEDCSGTMIINISFAILLAALWNGKRVIKIGTI